MLEFGFHSGGKIPLHWLLKCNYGKKIHIKGFSSNSIWGKFPSWSAPHLLHTCARPHTHTHTQRQWQEIGLSFSREAVGPQMKQLSGNQAIISFNWLTAYRGHRPSYFYGNRSGCWPWDKCGGGLGRFLLPTSSLCRISMQNLHCRSQEFKDAHRRGYFKILDHGFNCM